MTVKATREGLPGQHTASGYVIESSFPFVALPCRVVLGWQVKVTNPANGKSIVARVLDIGPWNINDQAYVFGGARPQAESGTDTMGRTTNRAGIDLGEAVWNALGMTDNTDVEWEFV